MLEKEMTPVTAGAPSLSGQPKRRFNLLVNNPVLEDYSLRYAPRSFRRWGTLAVASAALGGIAYLADFAIGADIIIAHGFSNALAAILLAALVIFLTGIPIAYYSARYNIDMDLLTRGAGFGYLGSTLTSLIYASFTFIFFALEGSIMAQALHLYTGLPLPWAYLVCALLIIPLVVFGMTLLAKLQTWTQPLWLVLYVLPFLAILWKDPGAFVAWTHFGGLSPTGASLVPLEVGAGAGVALSLIAQIGEQADYLRFMPDKTRENSRRWWLAVLAAGPGWVILGALKQLAGAFLAFYIFATVGAQLADQPIQQLLKGFSVLIPQPFVALSLATFFVLLSQVKINVTNAYSGSLSWSNFFSRILHRHPGRVVWLFLNVGIALLLMELNMFAFLNTILGFYSNVAIAWIGAVVADLVINKPLLKLSPPYIEFKRAHLYTINPVGFGSTLVASVLSVLAFFGLFGPVAQAFSPFLALLIAFVLSPLLAVLTRGKYYIARENRSVQVAEGQALPVLQCTVCADDYEAPDTTFCPYHEGTICSLCCTLEKGCHDLCKATA
ncbi:purine-cytosine permease family protein [Thermogemmatispora sp.]|uniref:purine-cytosine permease family protein n=1 Tax=Thermogemmatispora sp. TaxID=1968838 RepID=UPI0035E414AD